MREMTQVPLRYRLGNLPLPLGEDDGALRRLVARRLGVRSDDLLSIAVVKRSLDARKKGHPRWLVSVEVALAAALPSLPPEVSPAPAPEPPPALARAPSLPPIIVGAGPAGLFCAWALHERGVRSVIVDRGRTVGPRRRDVAELMRTGTLEPESNMYFGEGGAGAFTDGKLATRVHHPAIRSVVALFARFGGAPHLVADAKPHVGSDVLPRAVAAMREELVRGGCEFVWEARVSDLLVEAGHVRGVQLADGRQLSSDRVVLAPGNSARDLFELFARRGWPIEAKPFAAGFRVEHPQPLVDRIQYGREGRAHGLPAADYRLADNPLVGGAPRGTFSFCMCPGGVVVPTPTEPGLQCTNGMSNSHRSSAWANAGLVVSVGPADFAAEGFDGPLAGLAWQRKWERTAFELGGGGYRAPSQRLASWLGRKAGGELPRSSYRPGAAQADLDQLYPPTVREALRAALRTFDRRMRGFVTDEAILLGVETRTSSPCRLVRGEDLHSTALRGLYPCGEGAGYAGGITSSAIDGIRVAEAIAAELGPA
jgi:uncharacterized FAD-dependent dehydrogenase